MNKAQELSINAIRILSAEGVQAANSGHPGLPLGAAPLAYTVWSGMNANPKNPSFFNRDRFVLSAGHGSMLVYSLLHLFGYGLTKEDLMNFRQLNSKTPGHPEYKHTAGVETSTGPLGQGIANAVGMAQAESYLAAKFNKPDCEIVDHYTYVIAGDGCMMEGIESEAAGLAGTWGLNKLIVLYDSNSISIEGNTDIAFREDVAKRHEAQGWQVLHVDDGNDIEAIGAAITLAKADKKRPSLIVVRTVIGFGSPVAGSAEAHGAPLGKEGLAKTKEALKWTAKPFEVPKEVTEHMNTFIERGAKVEEEWKKLYKDYKKKYPQEAEELAGYIANKQFTEAELEALYSGTDKPDATRNSGGIVLNKLADMMPNLMGGSADLAPSTKTYLKGKGDYSKENRTGRNMHFGVKEHAMGAIVSGMYLHGGLNVFCSTFFVFSDYMKNSIRMAALMDIPVLYVFTHDSIGVGEDGPTHQPVEQLIGLRSIPNLKVFRPADYKETAAAYISAVTTSSPTAVVLTRQNLPQYANSGKEALKGGYIIEDCDKEIPDVLLMASGSEVELIVKAKAELKAAGIEARAVSIPCMELFDAQTIKYRESVLPQAVRARVAVEAASSYSWHKYTGLDGAVIAMDGFGTSAPADKLFEIFGFTAANVAATAQKVLKKVKK